MPKFNVKCNARGNNIKYGMTLHRAGGGAVLNEVASYKGNISLTMCHLSKGWLAKEKSPLVSMGKIWQVEEITSVMAMRQKCF